MKHWAVMNPYGGWLHLSLKHTRHEAIEEAEAFYRGEWSFLVSCGYEIHEVEIVRVSQCPDCLRKEEGGYD